MSETTQADELQRVIDEMRHAAKHEGDGWWEVARIMGEEWAERLECIQRGIPYTG